MTLREFLTEGADIMHLIKEGKVNAGSDGSVKDGIVGHAYCITDNTFNNTIWGYARTAGQPEDMTFLRSEHGGGLGILFLLYAMHIFYTPLTLSHSITVFIDNAEVIQRGIDPTPTLRVHQQLVLDYDLWEATKRLEKILPCTIKW